MNLPRLLFLSASEDATHAALVRELEHEFLVEFVLAPTVDGLQTVLGQQEVSGVIVDQCLDGETMIDLCQACQASKPNAKIFELKDGPNSRSMIGDYAACAIYRTNTPDAFDTIRSYLGRPVL